MAKESNRNVWLRGKRVNKMHTEVEFIKSTREQWNRMEFIAHEKDHL